MLWVGVYFVKFIVSQFDTLMENIHDVIRSGQNDRFRQVAKQR